MKFFGLGVPELLIILAVALLIFGPKNLPKLGASLGKTVKSIRQGMADDKEDDDEVSVKEAKLEEPRKKTAAVDDEDADIEVPSKNKKEDKTEA